MRNHDLKPFGSSTSGGEVVVVEEEDTTREVRRLESTLSIAMKQIKVSMASALPVVGIRE